MIDVEYFAPSLGDSDEVHWTAPASGKFTFMLTLL